jgi:hypothetical protein
MQVEKGSNWHWRALSLRFFALIAVFSAARFLFFLCNYKFFADAAPLDIAKAFAVGVRFDAATIAIFNAPIWVFWAFPLRFRWRRIFEALAEAWFIVANFLALLPNLIDSKFFSFTLRRMSGEIFNQWVLLTEDSSVYFGIFADYWYVVLAGVILTCALFMISSKFCVAIGVPTAGRILKRDGVYFLASIALLVICIRGGFQRKPLKPADSNIYAPTAQTAVLVNNSAFNIFHTAGKANLPPLKYFGSNDVRLAKFSPWHRGGETGRKPLNFNGKILDFKGKNVFIIILESFSAEHVGALDRQFKDLPDGNFTPFLDSLIAKSYVFDGFANGQISTDGLTAVAFGIPALFDSSYIVSAYSENAVNSLASILKKDGYSTLFFYGGKSNSCNFGSMRTKAQIEKYYCQCDYDGPSSDVSGWGVYDEEFFQFAAEKVSEEKQPFLSILFTLSSHHPYLCPQRLHGKFPKGAGDEPLEELIAYADYALRKFFETAEKTDWYKNTIFVLVADHTAGQRQKYYKNSMGRYSIPLIFFDPNGLLVGKSDEVAQQIDIMPSIFDLVGSKCDYFSFGSSLFDRNAPRFAVSYSGGIYQIITKDFLCRFDGEKVVALYERADFLLEKNLVDEAAYAEKKLELQEFIQVFLQRYSESILGNNMEWKHGR